MFAEVLFDDDSVGSSLDEEQKTNSSGVGELTKGGWCGDVIPMHRPGDKEFSCVAGTASDSDALYDPRLVNGDSWLTTECHCLRCETVRTSIQLEVLQRRNSAKKKKGLVVVLLDLDNFGFNHFRAVPPRPEGRLKFDVIKHIYVWCFFGSCFARYHGRLPDMESVCETDSQKDGGGGSVSRCGQKSSSGGASVWRRLVGEGRCHFTPCGGQRQGADGVLLQVAHAMTHMPIIVLSGDRELLRVARAGRRVVGKKASREAAGVDENFGFGVIDVVSHGQRFAPVWRALEKQVSKMLQN